MPTYWVSEPYINLRLEDFPLSYLPSRGRAVTFHLAYRQRGAVPDDPNVFGVGDNWTCSLRSYLADLGWATPGWMRLQKGGAGLIDYTNNVPQYRDGSILTGSGGTYQIEYASGAKDTFQKAYTNSQGQVFYFLISQSDPAGNAVTFNYASGSTAIQLLSVTDPDSKSTSLYYENGGFLNRITKVVDPFSRTNLLRYGADGRLTNIVDVAQISSSFLYDSGTRAGWITNLITPYGTTSFDHGGADAESATFSTTGVPDNRSITVTLPTGGHELYAYRQDCSAFLPTSYSSVPSTSPLVNTLDNVDQENRNSFHWDPLQYSHLSTSNPSNLTSGDYLVGRLYHWLIDPASLTDPSPTLSLQRAPSPDGSASGQLVWYDYDAKAPGHNNYAGTKALPSLAALVLPDGTTRFGHYARGAHSQVTQDISTYTASGGSVAFRTNTFAYAANSIDLLQQVGPLAEQVISNYFATTNTFHQPDASYDALNQATTYTYNANRQVTSRKTPPGLTTTNIYFTSGTDAGRLSTTIDLEISRTNSFTYTNGLVYSHTDERGLVTTNYWDNLQRLIGTVYPDASSVSNIYTFLDITATKDRLGYWTYSGFNGLRQKIAETNANGVVTRYGYCDCGALTSLTNAWNTAIQQPTSFSYDYQGHVTNTLYADSYSVTNWFNAVGQLVTTGDGWGYRWFYYNNQGLLTTTSNAFGIAQKTVFDTEDNPMWVTDANNVSVTNTFDLLHRMLSRKYPDGGTENFGYSAAGLIAYTNQIGASNHFALDPVGKRLFETNANNQLIQYYYNPAGDLTNLVDAKAQSTKWHYDTYGRVTNKIDQAGAEILRYQYDANSRLTNRWSAAKTNTSYSYDGVGNLLTITYPISHGLTFQYDGLNRLTNMVDAVGTTVYSYTAGNQLLTEDGPFANDTVTNTYVNRLRTALSLQQPTSAWTNGFGYDAAKRLTNVISPAGTFNYTYVNLPSLLVRKLALPNTAFITNNFDWVARLVNTSLKNSGGTNLDSYAYVYDPANERTNLTRADNSTVAFTYDKVGQLTIANSSVPAENRGYLYDAAWNLNRRTNNGVTSTFTVDNKNQLSSEAGITCAYDANGNLASVGNTNIGSAVVYLYDDENRLIEIYTNSAASGPTGSGPWDTQFTYDGLGRLRQRLEYTNSVLQSTTRYIYDGNRVIQERDGSNTPTVSYTRGNDLSGSLEGAGGIGGLLGRSSGYSSGNWISHASYFADANGNVTYLLNSSQTMVASYRYDPFGNTISSSGLLAGANVYRFSSKEIHVNSGMYYYLYRFYDPNVQRWINRDPLAEPGFETLHLVTQPLTIRKLRLGINDPQVKFFLAIAMYGGSINVGNYLRGSHTYHAGSTLSALQFLDLLRGGRVDYAPNWPSELLETPNLYGFVGNNPLNGIDSFGLWTWAGVWDSIKNGLEALWEGIKTSWGEIGTFLDTPKCPAGMYQSYTNAPVKNRFLNDPDNAPVPPQAGY